MSMLARALKTADIFFFGIGSNQANLSTRSSRHGVWASIGNIPIVSYCKRMIDRGQILQPQPSSLLLTTRTDKLKSLKDCCGFVQSRNSRHYDDRIHCNHCAFSLLATAADPLLRCLRSNPPALLFYAVARAAIVSPHHS